MDKVKELVRKLAAEKPKSHIIAALQVAFFISYQKANQVYTEAMR